MRNHELFPPDEDEDEGPDVEQIHVTRHSGDGQKWCGYLFQADELTTLQQIQEMFGGGRYELIARSHGRIGARRTYVLDGRSKPLAVGVEEQPPQTSGQAPAVSGPPSQSNDMLNIFTVMMQQSAQQQASNNQLMLGMLTMMTSVMQGSSSKESENNKVFLQSLAQMSNQTIAQQSQLLSAVLAHKGGGNGNYDPVRLIREGIDIAQQNGGGGEDDEDGMAQLAQTVGQVSEIVSAFNGGGAPVVDAPEVPQ